jgi:FdhD protein
MTARPSTGVRAIKVRPDHHAELPEQLATEEPMEVRLAGPGQAAAPVAVTMRTPGHDFELAAGFVVTEGLVPAAAIVAVAYCDAVDDEAGRFNTVTVAIDRPWVESGPDRRFPASSSCGICGKATLEQVELTCPMVAAAPPVAGSLITALPDQLQAAQRVFEQTGGLHGAGLFSPDGNPTCVREDVGRHNAVDKVAGHAFLNHLPAEPLAGWVLMVSGRVSFEIVQKAAMIGVGVIAAVSAPTSLAVSAADRLGLAIAGFVRSGSYNVYSHPERIDLDR